MDPYDSDSSVEDVGEGDYTETGVLLGYATEESTDDSISHLGGWPTWLDPSTPPPGNFAKCKVCNDPMLLLLQLNGDLPEHFPHDERWLYIFGCPRKACSRKQGSIRALRGVKKHKIANSSRQRGQNNNNKAEQESMPEPPNAEEKPKPDLGAALFGARPPSSGLSSNTNPFTTTAQSGTSQASNPFAALPAPSALAAIPPQKPSFPIDSLPATFAEKARVSSPPPAPKPVAGPPLPWPSQSSFPKPYPQYNLDADYETLSRPSTPSLPDNIPTPTIEEEDSKTSGDSKDIYESSLDKSFLRFSTRLAHNPEQVLRYEFRGTPLLYATDDAVAKVFLTPSSSQHAKISTVSSKSSNNRIPRCESCGSARVFEVQLVPHAIVMLEEGRENIGLGPKDDAGMEWGTVVLGVCATNCGLDSEGVMGWREEWVGAQWEERLVPK
ncbi:hypothetical protein AJ80_04426 [Polytolypa hystricis UAMH7299]|uniref:Programmed cell death protein 2 C-terminal domain-containing protein n=1 Tax=Polytolypa hystricis (strain UAMH7299) TaxID=1447883 RepID=A0A2B7YCP3_POLH7|nr:hypothetical protein AJ80_04426 [Polytolypa hystricis UAMH7299]